VKSSAHCLTPYWSIYYNKENVTGAHELAHLLSQHYWGNTSSDKFDFLLNEGFAFLADEGDFYNFNFYTKARKILKDDKYTIGNIVKHNTKGNYKKRAIVSGAFVKFLINQYGLRKFVKLWKKINEGKASFNTIYSKSFKDLESEFYAFIKD
jgi:hypothetical protein